MLLHWFTSLHLDGKAPLLNPKALLGVTSERCSKSARNNEQGDLQTSAVKARVIFLPTSIDWNRDSNHPSRRKHAIAFWRLPWQHASKCKRSIPSNVRSFAEDFELINCLTCVQNLDDNLWTLYPHTRTRIQSAVSNFFEQSDVVSASSRHHRRDAWRPYIELLQYHYTREYNNKNNADHEPHYVAFCVVGETENNQDR